MIDYPRSPRRASSASDSLIPERTGGGLHFQLFFQGYINVMGRDSPSYFSFVFNLLVRSFKKPFYDFYPELNRITKITSFYT
jgi:hypothetical protein